MDSLCKVFVFTWLLFSSRGAEHEWCTTPQYLEVGETGLVNCSFHENFFGVFWYNSTDTVSDKPIIKSINSVKSGVGYTSGEFDIHLNGSLIINNVSIAHSQVFTVAKFSSRSEDPVRFAVSVIPSVTPAIERPVIDECGREKECYLQVNKDFELSCSVRKSRPAISLQWVEDTILGERNVSSKMNLSQEGFTFTSSVITTNLFNGSSALIHLICKAYAPPGILQETQASILIELNISNPLPPQLVPNYFIRGSRLTLICSEDVAVALVWKKRTSMDKYYDTVLFCLSDEEHFTHGYSQQYELEHSGTLVIPNIEVQHEGFYSCVYSDGFTGGINQHEVRVYVTPVPSYPLVEGCNKQQNCLLEVHQQGNLTCSVTNVRPSVQLKWKTSDESTSGLVSFIEEVLTVSNNDDVFIVILVAQYRITSESSFRISAECIVSGPNKNLFPETTKVDLIYRGTKEMKDSSGHRFVWLLVTIIIAVVLLFLIGGFVVYCAIRTSKGNKSSIFEEEDLPMVPLLGQENDFSEKKQRLRKELASKYEELYNAVRPIPFITDQTHRVDSVFIEVGMKVLISNEIIKEVNETTADFDERRIRCEDVWQNLKSYRDIFIDKRVKSTRRILEGDPGFGKSTLAIKLAYDWCNDNETDLSKAEILILLRLRQLKGISSIYRAIKLLVLPRESKLTEGDIESVMNSSKSVLIVFDGYDEYPDKDNDNDVKRIITRRMFTQHDVILTTRTSVLPKDYSPVTKRIKLTGFNEKAREGYITKAVVGDNTVAAKKIMQHLEQNPVLGDLCQVPLIFVMFAHMTHDSQQFQSICSVTTFFQYMIRCFHSHARNKIDETEETRSFAMEHDMLDKVAFESLRRKNRQMAWWKDDLCHQLGKDFYDHYVSLGILVEEKVLDISIDPNSQESELIPYKKEVRFYHKLFCEWYAAHYLSKHTEDKTAGDRSDVPVASGDPNLHYTKLHLDPYDVQYLYRFACGLNSKAAEEIIKNLYGRQETVTFAILCTMELESINERFQNIKTFCSKDVIIKEDYSLLLQRSIVQLLQIASSKEISVPRLRLMDCFKTVELGETIHLRSGNSIRVLTTLKELWIEQRGSKMTHTETKDLLQYSAKCLGLEKLRFFYCLLPQSIQDEDFPALRSRKVRVTWDPRPTMEPRYHLKLENGQWEHRKTDFPMTDAEYEEEVEYARRWNDGGKH